MTVSRSTSKGSILVASQTALDVSSLL